MFDLSMFPEIVTPKQNARVTGVTIQPEQKKNPLKSTVTPVTPRKNAGVTKKSFKNSGVTPVTRVTPQKHNNQNGVTGNDPEEWREAFEERAGIMEYMGGLSRTEAERQARVICLEEFRNRRRKH